MDELPDQSSAVWVTSVEADYRGKKLICAMTEQCFPEMWISVENCDINVQFRFSVTWLQWVIWSFIFSAHPTFWNQTRPDNGRVEVYLPHRSGSRPVSKPPPSGQRMWQSWLTCVHHNVRKIAANAPYTLCTILRLHDDLYGGGGEVPGKMQHIFSFFVLFFGSVNSCINQQI